MHPTESDQFLNTELVYSSLSGNTDLREAIAHREGCHRDDVQITTGASEALFAEFLVAADEHANVLVPFPVFQPLEEIPRTLGMEVRHYSLSPENEYQPDLDEICELVDGDTTMVIVNSPHNPTGAVVRQERLQWLHDYLSAKDVRLVVDQVYHPIYFEENYSSAAALPHAIVISDFSKALSMSGLRLGWIVDRDHDRLRAIRNVRGYFTISNTPLAETIGTYVLRNAETVLNITRARAHKNRATLTEFFETHADVLDWVPPQGGLTAFPWLVDGRDARSFCESMVERGVLLVPGSCYRSPSHIRLGFGVVEHGFANALDRIAETLRHR